MRNFRSDPTWIPGVIIDKLAPLTYLVKVQGGLTWRRHIDHIKSLGNNATVESCNNDTDQESNDYYPPTPEPNSNNANASTQRYPSRNRQPPTRYM